MSRLPHHKGPPLIDKDLRDEINAMQVGDILKWDLIGPEAATPKTRAYRSSMVRIYRYIKYAGIEAWCHIKGNQVWVIRYE